MAKKDLDDIKSRLKAVKDHTKETKKIAENIGDKTGASRIEKLVEEIEKTEKHFENI